MDTDSLYFDPRCECDAPTYVDFTNITSQYDDNADDWFDQKTCTDSSGSHLHDETTENEGTEDEYMEDEHTQGDEGIKDEHTESDESTKAEGNEGGCKDTIQPDGATEGGKQRVPRTTAIKASKNITRMLKPGFASSYLETSDIKPKKAFKSTEQLQMEEIERMQLDAKKRLNNSRRSFQRLAKGSKPIKAIKGSKRPTQIKEFHFSKDRSRAGGVVGSQSEAIHPSNFAKTLRSTHPYDPMMKPEPVTRPKPFKFELDKRPGLRSSASSSNREIPVAEFIAKFQTTTPPRFRRTPINRKTPAARHGSDGDNYSLGSRLTNPKTPKLLTKFRARPAEHKSTAELEEEEALEMKRYHFKATLLNPDVIHKGGLLGVPRKRAHPNLTHPVSPQLTTKKIALARKALHGEDHPDYDQAEEDRKFFAQPMPDFSEIKGLPTKRPRPVTQPESPAMKKRCRNTEEEEGESGSHVIKANPMPNFEKVFAPQYPERLVMPEPFSFEERDKTKRTLVERILHEEKKPVFKAQPLPSSTFQPSFVPTLDTSVTKPQPFNLQTDVRGEQHSQKWKEQIDKQFQKEKKETEFKAKNVPTILYTKPFSPEKSTKPLTCVDNIVLHSEVRSSRRDQYEAEKQKRVDALETENLQRRALRDAKEAMEMTAYRKSLVHKANPIHHYTPLMIKPSDKPATQPLSPHFEIDRALKNKFYTKV